MSYIRELAQGLADGLAGVTFGSVTTQPSVSRQNFATVDLTAMADPVIFVTPGAVQLVRASRGVTQGDFTVTVFVGRHVTTEGDADDMLDLAEEVLLHIRAHNWGESTPFPVGITSPMTVSIDLNPDDALHERNVWRAVIEATYRVFEPDTLPG